MSLFFHKCLTAAAAFAAMALLPVSCQRRPLTSGDNNVTVNIDIDYDIRNVENPEEPGMMRVMFFDAGDGGFAAHSFVSPTGDPAAHDFEGTANVIPGRTYHVLAYNFDTETTIVGDEYSWDGIYATTNEVPEDYKSRLKSRATENEGELIVYEPDHHYVARQADVYIPARGAGSPPVTLNLGAHTIVETWKLYLDRINGVEWTASVVGVISGLALSNTLASDEESAEKASVFFESMNVQPDGKLEVVFNTFGYNPSESQIITLVVTDIGGKAHEFDFDVSDQFADNPEQVLRIKTGEDGNPEIDIEEPEVPDGGGGGGGLAPDVDEWDDVEIDIPI